MPPLGPGLALALTLWSGVVPALGTPLRLEGFSLRPPEGFKMVRLEPYQRTRVAAVGGNTSPTSDRLLVAALVDGDGDDASTLLVSRVEGTFTVSPSSRDEFATAAVRHFAEELGLTLMMERAERVLAPTPRIEVLATVRHEGQLRQIVIAGIEGEGRHGVVMFSIPSGRFEERYASVRASLDSFKNDPVSGTWVPRGVAGAIAGAMLGGLLVSYALWRRLRAYRLSRS